MKNLIIFIVLFFCFFASCGPPRPHDRGNENINTNVSEGTVDITSVVQTSFDKSVSIATDGKNITLKSNGLPNHKTPYWGKDHELYEDFPDGHKPNVNTSMDEHNYAMTIAAKPHQATEHEETTLGPIGMALNGVPIYNDREGGNRELDALTITTFDYAGAHPGPGEDYHYHVTGRYTTMDDDKLVGFLRDGYPLYGRQDMDGTYPTLDEFGGHISPTKEFPEGIYHYHTSNENYLNTGYYIFKEGSYYGTKNRFVH